MGKRINPGMLAALSAVAGTTGAGGDASTLEGQNGAFYLDRANHTGTQTASTISDFQTAVQGFAGNIPGKFLLVGAITPTSLTAATNDYNPPGLDNANSLFLSSTVNVDLTGILAQENGRVLFINNIGPNDIKLKNNNANSLPENRFSLRADANLKPGEGGIIIYNSNLLRWLLVAIY